MSEKHKILKGLEKQRGGCFVMILVLLFIPFLRIVIVPILVNVGYITWKIEKMRRDAENDGYDFGVEDNQKLL